MNWNQLGRQYGAKFNQSNPFFLHMGHVAEGHFKAALGLMHPNKFTKSHRKVRDSTPERFVDYQEHLADDRDWCSHVFEQAAWKLGAQKSQVVQGVLSGNIMACSRAIHKHLVASIIDVHDHITDAAGNKISVTYHRLSPSKLGHDVTKTVWATVNDATTICVDDIEKALLDVWTYVCSGRTQEEIDRDAKSERYVEAVAAGDAQAKRILHSNTKSKGVKITNAKQDAKRGGHGKVHVNKPNKSATKSPTTVASFSPSTVS